MIFSDGEFVCHLLFAVNAFLMKKNDWLAAVCIWLAEANDHTYDESS